MNRVSRWALLSVLLLGFIMATPPCSARWFQKDKPQVEKPDPVVTEPPAANAEATECEPFRQRAIELNQHAWLLYPVIRPIAAYNERHHRRCLDRIQTQERLYLKQIKLIGPDGEVAPTQAPTGR